MLQRLLGRGPINAPFACRTSLRSAFRRLCCKTRPRAVDQAKSGKNRIRTSGFLNQYSAPVRDLEKNFFARQLKIVLQHNQAEADMNRQARLAGSVKNDPSVWTGRALQEIVSEHFTYSDEFYSLVVSAFQTAVGATFTQQPHPEQAERKLLTAMAAFKRVWTDRALSGGGLATVARIGFGRRAICHWNKLP